MTLWIAIILYSIFMLTTTWWLGMIFYITKKHLPELAKNISFLRDADPSKKLKRILYGYQQNDGIISKSFFVNNVSGFIDKNNIEPYKKRFSPSLIKNLLLLKRLSNISTAALLSGFAVAYCISKFHV